MNSSIIIKTYKEPPVCEKEILRYSGCKDLDEQTCLLLNTCLDEARAELTYKVCFCELPVEVSAPVCDFGCFSLISESLSKNLKGCRSVILFCATVGLNLDRLIAKHSKLSPSRAVFLHAIGAERVEALCDAFCKDIAKEKSALLRPRFSPGYGDLPLDVQKDIFARLECQKNIAVFLNDSLLMSPTKSVTAFVGICP